MSSIQRVISPEEWKKRQLAALKATGQTNYIAGVQNPKADPIQRGIETEAKYAAAMRKALDNESRKKGLQKTSMSEWTQYSVNIGANKLVDGVVKREAKISKFLASYQPMLVSHLSRIDALSEETDSDREQRMLENLRGLKALKGKA